GRRPLRQPLDVWSRPAGGARGALRCGRHTRASRTRLFRQLLRLPPHMTNGLLIVTADDYGYSEVVTDATLNAYAGGGISATSAMMFMRDTERAAEAAPDRLAIGLHLNLSLPYEAASIPAAVS